MTHLNRFEAWLQGSKVQYPNQSGVAPGKSYGLVKVISLQLGHSQSDIDRAISQIRHWLAKNEHTGKANKRLWGKFFLTWLTPKSSRQGRLEPSNFD